MKLWPTSFSLGFLFAVIVTTEENMESDLSIWVMVLFFVTAYISSGGYGLRKYMKEKKKEGIKDDLSIWSDDVFQKKFMHGVVGLVLWFLGAVSSTLFTKL